ncbi:DMT family transporter [Pararhodospirillum photometricum]|nr:DMT family transporter [Pararhodospirillum photometricum]
MDPRVFLSPSGLFVATMILCTAFMGSSFPSGKYLISELGMPALMMGGGRFLLAGGLILAVAGVRAGPARLLPTRGGSGVKGLLLVLGVGCLQTAGTMGFLNLALGSLSASMASILLFTNPLWTAILAHFFLGESLSRAKIAALLCGVAGVATCLGVSAEHNLAGVLIALAGSVCWALSTVVSKKYRLDQSALVLTGWQLTLGALIMLAISALVGEQYDLSAVEGWGVVWFVWLVIPASIGSFGLWFYALSKKGATLTSSYLFLVPLFSTTFAVLFLGEALSGSMVIGGTMIVFALWLINIPVSRLAGGRERIRRWQRRRIDWRANESLSQVPAASE